MAKDARLGGKLRRLRLENRLNQAQMAEQLGISASYLNLIEHNQRPLTVSVLLKLNRAYNAWRAWRGKEYWSLSKAIKARVKSAVNHVSNFEEHIAATLHKRAFDRSTVDMKEAAAVFKNLPGMQREALEMAAEDARRRAASARSR